MSMYAAYVSALNKSTANTSSATTAWLLMYKGSKHRSAALVAALQAKKSSLVLNFLPRVVFKQPSNIAAWTKATACSPSPVDLVTTPLTTRESTVDAVNPATALRALVTTAVVQQHATLEMTSDGCGGVYLVQPTSSPIPLGVFKPMDEEYMAPQNPRGYRCPGAVVGETPHPAKMGFRVGDGAVREVAAYLLDAAYNNFSGVPVTQFVSLPIDGTWKDGSVQAFIQCESSAEDVGTLRFGVADVHKIAILDLRLFNTDRHAGNILLQQPPSSPSSLYKMVPIDHGLCLPSVKHLDSATFEWLHWPQAKFPLSPEAAAHVASLDTEQDAATLRSLGLPEECIATMQVCTKLLQKGVENGFSLYDVGAVVQREGCGSSPSKLELLVDSVIQSVGDVSSPAFLEAIDQAIHALWERADKCKGRSMSGL
ncbi:hypothetical protein H310_05498 [Aphanomyces invadans]|uniref:PI3K/PI4K catalytic domain-containing protein n=1 Tax=Aphanomyces invadans TaxID=157072 RepID=A0A024UA27_9STRA|nr:hypothetical protein H310_05498 [Aphanomyces invadans]ETW03070.1 hypothetical protein H310_05498 [Aphanomyces invadans]RHY34404.1 hypothetical protein DYB32_000968 [Aphanomyces invadans]|eukprot:XP_008868454.1 hypothetical protein H310_05498 [Aphanomyces invadans]